MIFRRHIVLLAFAAVLFSCGKDVIEEAEDKPFSGEVSFT